ncbi:MAG: phosphopantetheine-binding protein, partial [Verrucomicrobiota bacterium]
KVNRSTLAETLGLQAPAEFEEPATPMEKTLAGIWQRELNIPRVGRNDSYAELGGDSLSSMRMIFELEKVLGRRLPLDLLGILSIGVNPLYVIASALEKDVGPVVAPAKASQQDVALRIPREELTSEDHRSMLIVMGSGSIPTCRPGSLVKVINADGPKPAIFWVFNGPNHEMEGLAAALGPDQPLYGLYSGSDKVDRKKLPAIVEHYVKEIQAIQPEGSLIIAGNCRGGVVAIRMAIRLRELGREVSHLCVLEMFERPAYDFDGKLLILFGRQSHEFNYRDMNYGKAGWKLPFRHPPRVEWVSGRHAEFFTPGNVGNLVSKLQAFLNDEPEDRSHSAWLRDRVLLLIHRFPPAFRFYVRCTAKT